MSSLLFHESRNLPNFLLVLDPYILTSIYGFCPTSTYEHCQDPDLPGSIHWLDAQSTGYPHVWY